LGRGKKSEKGQEREGAKEKAMGKEMERKK